MPGPRSDPPAGRFGEADALEQWIGDLRRLAGEAGEEAKLLASGERLVERD